MRALLILLSSAILAYAQATQPLHLEKTIELPDGSALLLTVAKYQGPDGKKIQDEAVAPTVQVGQNNDDDDVDEDNAQPNKSDEPLNKALELLKAKNS